MSLLLAYRSVIQANIRRQRAEERRRRLNTDSPFHLPDREFIQTFRLNKEAVRLLLNIIRPYLINGRANRGRKRRSDALSPESKVFLTLAFYAVGSYQRPIGQMKHFRVSQATVSNVIREVTLVLNNREIFNQFVKFPQTTAERNIIKHSFYRKFKIPGVVGCIDGTHVSIARPWRQEELFYNRKGYHSLNVMLICDSELNILCIDPSKPGRMHDSTIWRDHPINQYLLDVHNSGEEVFLLGDSGYPLRKTMMTPITDTIPETPEHHYYELQVSARNTVERCIGVLKARFRCLLFARMLHYDPVFAAQIVNACAILHNIANKYRVPVPEAESDPQIQEQADMERNIREQRNEPENSRNHDLAMGRAMQQSLVNILWHQRNL